MLHINCKLHKTTDFYFLVLWTDDEKLSDVISHRDVMPPEGVNILDLKPAVEPLLRCAISHDSEDKYRLKVHRRAIKEDTLNQLK